MEITDRAQLLEIIKNFRDGVMKAVNQLSREPSFLNDDEEFKIKNLGVIISKLSAGPDSTIDKLHQLSQQVSKGQDIAAGIKAFNAIKEDMQTTVTAIIASESKTKNLFSRAPVNKAFIHMLSIVKVNLLQDKQYDVTEKAASAPATPRR